MVSGFRVSRIIYYAAAKLFAASFTLLLFAFCIAGPSLYDMSELIGTRGIFILLVPYAIGYSALADGAAHLIKKYKAAARFLLYLIGGHLPFLFVMGKYTVFTFMAGSVGSICALIFLGAYSWIRRYPKHAAALSIVLTAAAAVLLTGDFTVKKGWTETRISSSYEAEFAYFHGAHSIGVYAEAGDTVQYTIRWSASGGYGHHVLDDRGEYVAQSMDAENMYSFQANDSGYYSIVLTGDRLRGSFKIDWTLDR